MEMIECSWPSPQPITPQPNWRSCDFFESLPNVNCPRVFLSRDGLFCAYGNKQRAFFRFGNMCRGLYEDSYGVFGRDGIIAVYS